MTEQGMVRARIKDVNQIYTYKSTQNFPHVI